ncbi:hypothetical protein E1B28_008006 [Marasmius oreades]|uniref:ubiquitinyl hydrolase 1 n=1 Tax=Marasmius oreades TaxID=181124 RepID=A0A9P7S2S8_9AGAR|nr:uncharacterized protein E1B28_008006 [Marasmius oreades]KAG7094406.1 hypothetical protein E1B28_008006 [Marasmius oreades]
MSHYNLSYLIHHIFLPPKLPQSNDLSAKNEHDMCAVVHDAALAFGKNFFALEGGVRWVRAVGMLKSLRLLYDSESYTNEAMEQCIKAMTPGDVTACLIRAQNAGFIIRKLNDRTVYESFEVSVPNEVVMGNNGKLVCVYPGPAISVSSDRANNPQFIRELANFLAHMNVDVFEDAMHTARKAGSQVVETRDTPHPRYITELLTGILRGMGSPEDVPRIAKRIADDILWDNTLLPWRRSPLWLVIRVALQTSLRDPTNGSHALYKSFMTFLMSKLLRKAVEAELDSDLISVMHKKLARRLYKIRDTAPSFLQSGVLDAGKFAQALLQKRWEVVQEQYANNSLQGWNPASLDFLRDTTLSLTKSRSYISGAMKKTRQASPSPFHPNEHPRLKTLHQYNTTAFTEALEKLRELALYDFERAIEDDIDVWVWSCSTSRDFEKGCSTISEWINIYSKEARSRYQGNPEEMSVMFLTLLELWIGLDKLCTSHCDLVLRYSPEIKGGIFTPLLLRRAQSIDRLKTALQYLRKRQDNATVSLPSIFSPRCTSTTFPVAFFNSSSEHQSLRQLIEQKAELDRQEKVEELNKKNEHHRNLERQAASQSHKESFNVSGRRIHKKKKCPKCKLEKEMSSMEIRVLEWPLPSDDSEAKGTVFELAPPVVFSIWRDTTYFLLHDVFTPVALREESSAPDAKVELQNYSGLSSFMSSFQSRRLMLASTTKSWGRTHYKSVGIPNTEGQVCLKNGLELRLFDTSDAVWISQPFAGVTISSDCTFLLPPGPYSNLQYAVDSTAHTSNEVLAKQSECSRDLTLHEYISFCSLRAGARLQWLNLLRELRARILTFSQDAVEMLIAQTVLQMGPLSRDDHWEWHRELYDPVFQSRLLDELKDLKDSIQANWSEVASMRTITLLTHRVLIWCGDDHEEGRTVLHSNLKDSVRIAHGWMKEVYGKLQKASNTSQASDLQLRLCEMAAACRSAGDLDSPRYDVALMVEAGLILRDNMPAELATTNSSKARLFTLDRRLRHSFEPYLASIIANGSRTPFNQAILEYWPAYNPKTHWVQQSAPNDRWLCSKSSSHEIAFNMLESLLLIDGKRLGRLPFEIMSHPTYSRILGQAVLDAVPSDEFGAQFVTKTFVSGYQIFFNLSPDTNKLVIKAKCRKTNRQFEVIPHTELFGDLPQFLVDDYAHWLDLDEGVIELRPLSSLWVPSSINWHLEFLNPKPFLWRESSSGIIRLIDPCSPTAVMIAARLHGFESSKFLTISCSMETLTLTIDVPRYRLAFQLNLDGQLTCLTLPDMMVDDNQSAGIMVGLQSRLVLRDRTCSTKRELLVPIGDISFSPNGHHTLVTIDTGSRRRVSYYRYVIDDILGRIVENSGIHAKLYTTYLTAITSHCLPDPLTGRRGTEEALHELRSASCRSFIQLDLESQHLLQQLGDLSPKRRYYPEHLRSMQTVEWKALSFLSQNDTFRRCAQDILAFALKLKLFGDKESLYGEQEESNFKFEALTERAALRNSCYYPPEFHMLPEPLDHHYPSRDFKSGDKSCPENLVFSNSSLIASWPSQLSTTCSLKEEFLKRWPVISGPDAGGSLPNVSYCRYWMEKPLSETWMHLYDLLRQNGTNMYQVLFTLCAIGYMQTQSDTNALVPTLLAFAVNHKLFSQHPPPSWQNFPLSAGFEPNRDLVLETVRECSNPFRSEDYAEEVPETDDHLKQRRKECYRQYLESEAVQMTDHAIAQWPCTRLTPMPHSFRVLDISRCLGELKPLFTEWYHNHKLSTHLDSVQAVLDSLRTSEPVRRLGAPYSFDRNRGTQIPIHSESLSFVSLDELFRTIPSCPVLELPPIRPSPLTCSPCHQAPTETEPDYHDLHTLVNRLQVRMGSISNIYADDLNKSLNALQAQSRQHTATSVSYEDRAGLYAYQAECETHLCQMIRNIQKSLGPTAQSAVMYQAGLWPHLELRSLLESLASIRSSSLSAQWMGILRHLARSLLVYQRSRRLLRLARLEKYDDLRKEAEIDPSVIKTENSDWLLLQADSDFLARRVQLTVAQEMISPSADQNTLLQLNMGEGKSSVIVPMAAATLANRKKLVRVIVLKSLAGQMFSLLRQRLGGLTNRQILYLPFSRAMKVGMEEAEQIRELFRYAMNAQSILVAQPEHILSFKLMAIHRLVEREAVSKSLVETQLWLDQYSRDLLDESDEILHTRYQLVYTIGNQQMVENGSDRWTLIQQVLSLLRKCAPSIRDSFPSGIEVGDSLGNRFPSIRILQAEAGAQLISEMLRRVMEGAASFYVERFPLRIREIAKSFIMNEVLVTEDMEVLKNQCSDPAFWNDLLLLKGLFGHGILVYTLKERRWRVDFGLDLSRSLLAVPYRAKDIPSLRAEFGHPDVAIVLTCLSYLYGGLSQAELDTCFQLLFKLDNPELEYDHWVRFANIPEGLRSIAGVNLKDSEQRQGHLFPIFRHNHACIDFYLSNVVFPKAMKEFPQKLATSGWDLACRKKQITTGFSGTNENRYLLPTSISQEDTPERISTNASMLVLLSRPENDWYMSPSSQNLSGGQIIDAIVDETEGCDIRVLLDVGAQILEMTNIQVAQYWLSRRPDALAAVFFNGSDELEVMTRDGSTEILSMSPFHQRLDDCLVYLDDAHTRGTDLKLPTTWKACVTLGPKVTKDRLAQGCMRMRKLGHGQSVMFMAPPDIDTAIRKRSNKLDPSSKINSRDVLIWAMLETCAEIERQVPHWLQQGADFHSRNEGWKAVSAAQGPSAAVEALSSTWSQPEARTLQDMYGCSPNLANGELVDKARKIPEIRAHCERLGVTSVLDPRLAEEQEREVNHEIEREAQLQRPPRAQAAEHVLHQHVELFVQSGFEDILTLSEAFGPAFVAVRDGVACIRSSTVPLQPLITAPTTSPKAKKKTGRKKSKKSEAQTMTITLVENLTSTNQLTWNLSKTLLLATRDFLKTIRSTSSSSTCDYLRPLNWVLTSCHSSSIVILSSHEVNQLLPAIRQSDGVRLHLYTPRTIQSVKPTDDLQLYTIPSTSPADDWPTPNQETIDHLNLCAGQLYFSDYEAYLRTSSFLGLSTPEDQHHEMEIEQDGFVKPENRVGQLALRCKFEKSPVPYLKALTGFRRRGITFEPTHLGKLLHGRLLRKSDFDSTED